MKQEFAGFDRVTTDIPCMHIPEDAKAEDNSDDKLHFVPSLSIFLSTQKKSQETKKEKKNDVVYGRGPKEDMRDKLFVLITSTLSLEKRRFSPDISLLRSN